MRITNCGRGIHRNEVVGVDLLKTSLPAEWYAFTNLDLVVDAGTAREVDIIVVTNKRILVLDLKKWEGKVSGADGNWYLDGQDFGPSPVPKVCDIARQLYYLVRDELAKNALTRKLHVPKVDGLVVMTESVDLRDVPAAERAKVMPLKELLKALSSDGNDRACFGVVSREILDRPLTDSFWKDRLTRLFNAGASSPLKPGRRRFDRFLPDEAPAFEHPQEIYKEYNAQEEGTPPSLGTLRLWDFASVADARFQSEDGRKEIVGRERRVFHWLRDRSDTIDRLILQPRVDDVSGGVRYWEIYDRRKRLKRLSDWSTTERVGLTMGARLELARQTLSGVAELHRLEAAHFDVGEHSVWLEAPTTVKFSHFFAASHPDVQTLGPRRYNFLASAKAPEDILEDVNADPLRRDVYLLGVAVHQILFGALPAGDPPEWSENVDAEQEFETLHGWFAEALDFDQGARFADARVALEAFNQRTAERPSPAEVIAGLDSFRGRVKFQRQLVSEYPIDGEIIRESDALDVWRSKTSDGTVLVKVWKQAAWGNLDKERKRILAFLERAAEIRADGPAGIPTVVDVFWLGDGFAIVQAWVEGMTLEQSVASPSHNLQTVEGAIDTVMKFEALVSRLHEAQYGHGDLKPENIIVDEEMNFTLVDFLDFSSQVDGERQNRAYSNGGDKFERDRFAVLKISEEILGIPQLPTTIALRLNKAIQDCRSMSPRLSTLTPLAEALSSVIQEITVPKQLDKEPSFEINVSIKRADTGPIEPEEGRYYVRTYGVGPAKVVIRGAFEEIEFRLGHDGVARSASRTKITPTRIAIVERQEIHSFVGKVSVEGSFSNDFRQLVEYTSSNDFRTAYSGSNTTSLVEDQETASGRPEEETEENLAEEVSASKALLAARDVDVPALWRELIEIEKELTTEALVVAPSRFDRAIGRHIVAIDLESGVFDFDRNDTVGVQKLHNGTWRRVGELDVSKSTSSSAVIEAIQFGSQGQGPLMEPGQRLKFISHFEAESLRRRAGAVERILAGDGRAKNLVSVFAPTTGARPMAISHNVLDDHLTPYALNYDQTEAFKRIVKSRPVGLLQGPPGTGKTRFIAALAHYAITQGLAKNVLLSSQSHEAVNTAGEALLKLFRKSGGEPSVLRVGMSEEQVSDIIRPFHTSRVEQSIKDRFQSTYQARVSIAGRALGLSRELVGDIVTLEQSIVPLSAKFDEIQKMEDTSSPRLTGIQQSLESILGSLDLPSDLVESLEVGSARFLEDVLDSLMGKHRRSGVSGDKIIRLRSAARVGTDFVTSTSSFQRSFEPFLAATRQIVMGTCVGLGRTSLGLTNTAFDLVIIDEAARCTASELLVPLQSARWAVLVGDQAQLQPLHKAEVVNRVAARTRLPKNEILRSDFERVFSTTYGDEAGARLQTQYRMLEPIGRIVSETFYPSLKLKAGRSERVLPENCMPVGHDEALTWIDTSELKEAAFDSVAGQTGSRINRVEADAIVRLLEKWLTHDDFKIWLTTQTDFPIGVGVICMYSAQRDLLRRKLLHSSLAAHLDRHIKVGTVDSYQGKENPIVLLSLVRNNTSGSEIAGVRSIREGFLSTPNRINVAASRSMDKLVIVGALNGWLEGKPMGKLANAFRQAVLSGNASVHPATDLLGEQQSAPKRAKQK